MLKRICLLCCVLLSLAISSQTAYAERERHPIGFINTPEHDYSKPSKIDGWYEESGKKVSDGIGPIISDKAKASDKIGIAPKVSDKIGTKITGKIDIGQKASNNVDAKVMGEYREFPDPRDIPPAMFLLTLIITIIIVCL